MRTSWIVSLALIGFGCSSTASHLEAQRDEKPPIVNGSVLVHSGTGSQDAADVVELIHVRITRAYDILAARGSCYMPPGQASPARFGLEKAGPPAPRPPLPQPGEQADIRQAEWVQYETNQEDYDFLGVDVDLSPDGRSVVVTSKFGDEPGLLRVVTWVREKLKP